VLVPTIAERLLLPLLFLLLLAGLGLLGLWRSDHEDVMRLIV
jgi:hypothetical protein